MQTFDQSLFHLLQAGLITNEEALRNATNPDEFRMRTAGILSSDDAVKDIERIGNVSTTNKARTEGKEVKV
jgi:twitching motility protein PilT